VSGPNPNGGLEVLGSSSGNVTIPTGGSGTQNFRYHGGRISGYAFCVDFCTCPWKITLLKGVIITLKDSHGNVITTVTTNDCGYFAFDDCLAAGCYTISAPGVFNGHKLLTCKDIDVCIKVGEKKDCNFFAYDCSHSTICGTVFCDKDNDDKQDCGEKGIQDVTVTLKDDCGNVVATTKTDCNGNYCFKGLNGGKYNISVPDKWKGMPVTCKSSKDVCVWPCGDADVDFGYKCATICGKTFVDCHWHGRPDCDEGGWRDCNIILKDCDGNEVCRTKSDCDGKYKFDDCLKGGTYKVCTEHTKNGKTCRTGDEKSVCVDDGGSKNDCHFGYR
jgi:hypothetical protein